MSLRTSCFRSFVLPITVAAAVFALGPAVVHADPQGTQLLFKQQDTVQSFDLVTGKGTRTGTVTGGLVSGTSSTTFQLTPSAPPTTDPFPITFHEHVIVTDLDGDQIAFDGDGTGAFHLGIAPGFTGSGGSLGGSYVVASGTGKFSNWTGSKFGYKAIATNPPTPPGGLGTVYGETTFRGRSNQN